MRTILLSAAAWHKGCTAADTGSVIRTDHVFFSKQLTPNDPVQFRIDGQYAFQKVIAVDGSIVNRRIPGIDDSTVSMVNAFAVDVIAAFPVSQGSDLTDHLSLHIFSFEVGCFLCCVSAACPITQWIKKAVLRSDHASRRHDAGQLYVNAQDSFSYAELLGLGSYEKMAGKHSSKQGKRSTFCTLLVGGHGPPSPFHQRKRCGCFANQRDSSS